MGPKGQLKAIRSHERRLQREAQLRRRELERLEKEKAKLTAIEQARLEVETHENQIEVLLSVHKEPCEQWDWIGLAAALPHPIPKNYYHSELRAKQLAKIADQNSLEASNSAIRQGREIDERNFLEARNNHSEETASMEKLRDLAMRILSGERMAFIEAFAELNAVAEFSAVGSLRQFAVEDEDLIECTFKVNANDVIPSEVKTLTANNKVSIKPMPKAKFHEIYQDYVCACVLRMAREIFAMLPAKMLLITALADVFDPASAQYTEHPVLSVAVPRAALDNLNFDELIASNAIDGLRHRGNFKVSRKAGTFLPIVPIAPSDVRQSAAKDMSAPDLHNKIRGLRETLLAESSKAKAFIDRPAFRIGNEL